MAPLYLRCCAKTVRVKAKHARFDSDALVQATDRPSSSAVKKSLHHHWCQPLTCKSHATKISAIFRESCAPHTAMSTSLVRRTKVARTVVAIGSQVGKVGHSLHRFDNWRVLVWRERTQVARAGQFSPKRPWDRSRVHGAGAMTRSFLEKRTLLRSVNSGLALWVFDS